MTNSLSSIPTYLTFDDVLLLPSASSIIPSDVSLATRLTTNISLSIPFISAAMDTVTESSMAIAMARMGGIGIVHRSLSVENQAEEIAKVKRVSSVIIKTPKTINIGSTVNEARMILKTSGFSGLPVIGGKGQLVGIVTSRDLKATRDNNLKIAEIMSKDLITGKPTIGINEARELMLKNRIEKLPLVNGGKLFGLMTLRDIEEFEKYPNANKDKDGHLIVGAAVGTGPDTNERVAELCKAGVDVIIVDTAHGHSSRVIKQASAIRKTYPNLELIVGNVVTAEAAKELINIGVNGVKVGVGPGSICTTRVVAGVGAPQLTAIAEVYSEAKKSGTPIIADGGIRYSGDVVKALAAGANSVMMGSMLAGCEESPGVQVIQNGKLFKTFRGMGSVGAMKLGSRDRYFQDGLDSDDIELERKLVPEGIEGIVSYKGKVQAVLYQLSGGLRAGMGYVGAKDLDTLTAKANFIRITQSSLKENHPHDVIMTKDAPNYTA